jgi:dipeptidase
MAACRQLQSQTDARVQTIDEISAELTQVNDQMAQISLTESTKLLGRMVKEAFKHEKLQY